MPDACRTLFDGRVRLVVRDMGDPDPRRLHADEQALVIKAVPKRVREFAAGRLLAHEMLRGLGRDTPAILRGPHGSPVWPQGVRGTISHAGAWVGAALTVDAGLGGIGLDLEDAKPLEEKYWHVILTQEDMAHLDRFASAVRPEIAKIMFSAKEAAYKAQFAFTQTYLPFSAMDIRVDPSRAAFVATFHQTVSPFRVGETISGSIARFDAMVATAVTLDTR